MRDVWEKMSVCVCVFVCMCADVYSSVLHLLKELVGWVLVAILLHLGQVALLGGDGSIHLEETQREVGEVTHTVYYDVYTNLLHTSLRK